MSRAEIVFAEAPTAADRDAIVRPLVAFNDATYGPSGFRTLAFLLRDPETGETVGGLYGKASYDWLFVELLVVPAALRGTGLGSELIGKAETYAREAGLAGVWLDTFGFQARAFYEKQGFEVFGSLPGHPRGSERFFLRKAF
ncbi:N-acetyltransferase [Methylopila jiangsuensis]|uniref:N-acetyltransferase n=1 Tax=Methylopila jiangsuensis TaxID=586230 RepID=A0A9W6JJV8_9HYPH|nr:GNAT family N-acetyltransferase [Methylopila jiangsuensis]MDR6286452.1 GNAT superfamily N-acetyltransferase [Methylopila jiangsuensis]GLK77210.1 N-acetyltransferase [Methylopila jiangsuensis]